MSLWVAVKIQRNSSQSLNMAHEVQKTDTFGDLAQRLSDIAEDEEVKVEISSVNKQFKMSVEMNSPFHLCEQFNASVVTYFVSSKVSSATTTGPKRNAFAMMMASTSTMRTPAKKDSSALTNFDRLYNNIIDFLEEQNVRWSPSIVNTTGIEFVKCLTSLLWHITCHHDVFEERAAKLPAFVLKKFANLNDYFSKKKSKPKLSCEAIVQSLDKMSSFMIQPWMNRKGTLIEALKILSDWMNEKNKNQKRINFSATLPREVTETTSVRCIDNGNVLNQYEALDAEVNKLELYTPLHLANFEPSSRYNRRHWLDNVKLASQVAIMTRHYGGSVGNINILWRIHQDDQHETNMARATLAATEGLPIYHTRQMRKDFICKYQRLVKTSTGNMKEIYRELTGDVSAAENAAEDTRRERITNFVMSSDEDGLLLDFRTTNGNLGSTVFDAFWDEVQQLFNEYTLSVHERRHETHLYLPFAISIRELIDRIKERKPEIKVPSEEWVRLQFQPRNPSSEVAFSYTGRFPIKFQVQRRQLRATHADSKYVYHQQRYVKEFATQFKQNCKFVSADDKAMIPIGEPHHAVSTGVRAHNQSLGPADTETCIEALDHDWKVAGAVASINLYCEVPDTPKASFYGGNAAVTIKDRVFEKSNAMRHYTELCTQIRKIDDSLIMKEELLMLVTDGGSDHNISHASVQVALICLFMQLDLDMLVAMRTCPSQSWTNLAERVMSVLNLALQNVATERNEMEPHFEEMVRRNNNLTKLREAAQGNAALKEAYTNSMASVLSLFKTRFERMKVKEQPIMCYPPADEQDISKFFDISWQIDPAINQEKLLVSQLNEIDGYNDFFKKHCFVTTYMFQVKKCQDADCFMCTDLRPPRLPMETFQKLHFLPAPVLDETKEHFQEFSKVYGTTPTEKDKPSLKFPLEFTAEDKLHKPILISQRVRSTISCRMCKKTRCVFSASKLTDTMKKEIKLIREEDEYACGGSLFSDDHLMRHICVTRCELACHVAIEPAYYSSNMKLTPVCCHCGSTSGAELAEDETIIALRKKHTSVTPICNSCKAIGKFPRTRGTKFNPDEPATKKRK